MSYDLENSSNRKSCECALQQILILRKSALIPEGENIPSDKQLVSICKMIKIRKSS